MDNFAHVAMFVFVQVLAEVASHQITVIFEQLLKTGMITLLLFVMRYQVMHDMLAYVIYTYT